MVAKEGLVGSLPQFNGFSEAELGLMGPFIMTSDFTLLASMYEVGGIIVDTHW